MPTDATDEEALFDGYAALARDGRAPPPADFLAAAPSASADLRAALERVWKRAPRGATSTDAPLPFARLGDFRLVSRLGGGGMGIVYLAVQESLGREVALKVLRPELQGSAVAAERFRREARALAELRHDHLVAIFGGGEEHGVRYLAMELVPGRSLDERLLAEPGAPRGGAVAQRVRWIAQIARGLQHAHERGVVHRDVKPANVRITPDDRARLLDFGLARRTATAGATLTESFAGSPSYAAPEQIAQGGTIDARTDVYALGVTLYECLTGALPYAGATVEQLFHRILAGLPEPPRRRVPQLPRDLEVVVLKAMERRPEQRYASAAALADDLEAVLELRPIRGRPPAARERARRIVERHPLLATFAATAAAALLGLLALLVAQHASREREARGEASRLVALARGRVVDYRTQRESLAAVQSEVARLQSEMESQHYTDADYALLDRNEGRLEDERRRWDATYHEVLELLRRAEQLDPATSGADGVRGELYLARYHDALAANDPRGAELFRDLAAQSDPALADSLRREIAVTVASTPAGARVDLFRFAELSDLEPGGEPRFVALPAGPAAAATPLPIAPGTWCLRVEADAEPLRRGDLLFEVEGAPLEKSVFVIDGGGAIASGARLVAVDDAPIVDDWDVQQLPRSAPPDVDHRFTFDHAGLRTTLTAPSLAALRIEVGGARRFGRAAGRMAVACKLVRDGAVRNAELPPAAPVEATARPLLRGPASHLGTTPLATQLPRGDYLFVVEVEGRPPVLLALPVGVPLHLMVEPPPLGQAPAGFRWIADGSDDARLGFWIAPHEVTSAEWSEFLDDEATRAPLVVDGALRLVPRAGRTQPFWPQEASGRFRWPPAWSADWPAVGLSWHDAQAYVDWLNQQRPPPDRAFEWALPTFRQYTRAALGHLGWTYVYGQRLRPRWSRCCFAHRHANLGPVLEFPVDESPLQLFDLTGGAFEWLDHWYDEPRGMRMANGGAWGQARTDALRVACGVGMEPHQTSGETGLRLVLRRKGVEPLR